VLTSQLPESLFLTLRLSRLPAGLLGLALPPLALHSSGAGFHNKHIISIILWDTSFIHGQNIYQIVGGNQWRKLGLLSNGSVEEEL
jgi:hypothetical protein